MSRRQEEPVFIAEYRDRTSAEAAWSVLTEAGIASVVITDDPPWGPSTHRIQVSRRDAPTAIESLNSP